jgi:hypothetical protein
MGGPNNTQVKAVVSELEKYGASVIAVEHGGVHLKVRFSYRGMERFVVTAGSPSDAYRGAKNARCDVRRTLGIVREKRVGERRQRKERIDRPTEKPIKLTPGRDPFAELKQVRLRDFDPDAAWKAFVGQIMRDNGHEPQNGSIRAAMGV